MAYSGLGAGTVGDPFQITTMAQFRQMDNYVASYWKLMNNIDFAADAVFYITTFNGYLDGNGYQCLNMASGYSGFGMKDASSINNITLRYTRVWSNSNAGWTYIISDQSRTMANISLTNIHLVITGTARVDYFSVNNFATSCTINNIVIEGRMGGVFTGTINGLIENVRVLRNYVIMTYYPTPTIVASLGTGATMRYCQSINPMVRPNTGGNFSFLVGSVGAATIQECFVVVGFKAIYTDAGSVVHGFSNNVYSSTGTIIDSYIKGSIASNNGIAVGFKTGFAIAPNQLLSVSRCFFSGDLNTPTNNNRCPLYTPGSSSSHNNYYNKTKLTSITAIDETGKQTGLTSAEMLNSSNFANWDFNNVWNMGSEEPVLRNNPMYAFELDPRIISIASTTRNSNSQVTIVLDTDGTNNTFGIDVVYNSIIIFNAENALSNIVPVDNSADKTYIINLYWNDNGTKTYVATATYLHYSDDRAVLPATNIATSQKVSLTTPLAANLVHGSCILGNYVYGSTRNTGQTIFPCLVQALLTNLSGYVEYPIRLSDTDTTKGADIEQIVVCGGKIYGRMSGKYIIQFDPAVNDYKIFLVNYAAGSSEPLVTDGTYLFLISSTLIYKINPTDFDGAPKYNTAVGYTLNILGTYLSNSQGGHIAGGWPATQKGIVHSALCDSEFLYVAYSTGGDYSPTYGTSFNECHKISISNMTAAGWSKIPKCTDDMCQTETHLFFGVEVQPAANVLSYGYGWGAIAIRKSDMAIRAIPRFHSTDNPPAVQSYASLLFGNYLLDARTSAYVFILDISDVENWNVNEPIGKRNLKRYRFNTGGTDISLPPNEFLLSDAGLFYAFIWAYPSGLMEVDLTGLDFFAVPTVNTIGSSVINNVATLTGYLLNTGGKTITGKGFHYGTAVNELTSTITSGESSQTFHAILSGLDPGVYYYKSFAINSVGESINSTVMSFTITGTICIGATPIKKVYKGGVKITKI